MCSVLRLHSFSRGIGGQRRLFIGSSQLAAASADGKWTRPDAEVKQKAAELHALLIEEQGGHCQYSVGELEEMVAAGDEGVPREVTAFRTIRWAPFMSLHHNSVTTAHAPHLAVG